MKLKESAVQLLVRSGFVGCFRPWMRRHIPILMLHRFSHDPAASGWTSAALLESCLAHLSRSGVQAVTLADLCEQLKTGRLPSRVVCLTVDDGYADFKEVAFPILRKHGMPATVFIASRFIDGDFWYWWDRIEYAFRMSRRDEVHVAVGAGSIDLAWADEADRLAAQGKFTLACKEVEDELKWRAISALERELRVDVPLRPPAEYQGMSWDDVRELLKNGVEFGAHTASHPILSRLSEEKAESEVVEGIAAIEKNTGVRPRTFAYPNGRPVDFTRHVIRVLEREKILGAVTGSHGIVSPAKLRSLEEPMFRLPRIGMPNSYEMFVQYVSGLEALKQAVGYA